MVALVFKAKYMAPPNTPAQHKACTDDGAALHVQGKPKDCPIRVTSSTASTAPVLCLNTHPVTSSCEDSAANAPPALLWVLFSKEQVERVTTLVYEKANPDPCSLMEQHGNRESRQKKFGRQEQKQVHCNVVTVCLALAQCRISALHNALSQ